MTGFFLPNAVFPLLLGAALSVTPNLTPAQAQQPRYSSDWQQKPAAPQAAETPARPPALDALLKELGKLTSDAARQRAADPRFLADLNDLVRRYAWPWTRPVASDDFADGDHTSNPAWRVTSGAFAIGPNGLAARNTAPPAAPTPPPPAAKTEQGNQDLGAVLFGTVLRELSRNTRQQEAPPPAAPAASRAPVGEASLFLARSIPNSFAARIRFHAGAVRGGHLEIGLAQGTAALGYFVKLETGATATLSLIRRGSSGSAVIESAVVTDPLDDGKFHELLLTRDAAGHITVTLDGVSRLRVVDRAFRSAFDRFQITVSEGDYSVRSVALYGAQ
jgi:hypothetical protein